MPQLRLRRMTHVPVLSNLIPCKQVIPIMPSPAKTRFAMTLVEIVLVSVLLTAIAVAILAFTRQPGERVKSNACDLELGRLQVLVEQYRLDYGRLPSSNLNELLLPRYNGGPLPICPVDGQAYQLNAQTGQIVPHAH